MNQGFLKSLRAAAISVLAQAAQATYSAGLFSLLALFFFCLPAGATNVRLGPFTNSITLAADTNAVLLYPVSGPVANADGSFTTIGLPKRIYPTADGSITNNLAANNYLVTNAAIAPGIVFRVPTDSGPTVYRMYDLRISGYNTFVTVIITNGTLQSLTFNILTNVLGGTPLYSTNLPALTNGYAALPDATNISATLDAALSNALRTLTFASSNFLYGDYNTKIAQQTALGLTNVFATNAAGVSFVNGRGYISTNYDGLGAALAIGLQATNYTLAASNNLYSQITLGGISAVNATNLANSIAGDVATNGSALTFKFTGTGTNDIRAIAAPLTNNIGVSSQLSAFAPTNQFDGAGAALAIGLQSTNYTLAASNNLYSQITLGGISAASATNLANSISGDVATNGSALTFKFTGAGTNDIRAIAAPLTNNIGVGSQLSAFAPTNQFDPAGAAAGKVDKLNGLLSINATNSLIGTNNSIEKDVPNSLSASNSVITGGVLNTNAGGSYSVIGGGKFNQMRADDGQGPDYSFIGGGSNNIANSVGSVVVGGRNNDVDGGFWDMFIGGGNGNRIFVGAIGASIVGGEINRINQSLDGFIGGGISNSIIADGSDDEDARGTFLAGGIQNRIGTNNNVGTAIRASSILGGESNLVNGAWSVAGGFNSHANNDGVFVIGDSLGGAQSTGSNQFVAKYTGGYFFTGGSIFGNGSGITNASATNLALGALGQVTNIANARVAVASNGLVATLAATNTPTIYTPNITGGNLNGFTNNNGLYFFNSSGSFLTGTAFGISANPLGIGNLFTILGSVTATNGTFFGKIAGNGWGITNASTTNITGAGLNQVTNIASSLIGVSLGITNAIGTNFPNGTIINNTLFYPTNFDGAGGSNFLYWNTVGKTNGFGTGDTLTNLSIQGDVNMGRDGASLVFLGRTNFIAFTNAGSGIVTNGAFVWMASLNEYTNFFNGATITNNSSQWLAISNGVTLYSLSGASPIGAYSAVSGVAPNPTAVYTEAANDHLVQAGYLSPTNLNLLFSNATNSLIAIFTNGSFTGSISVSNGFGTNTTLRFANAAWGSFNSVGSASYAAAFGGLSNSAGSFESAVVGGLFNNASGVAGQNFIGGGFDNVINAGGCVIGGGTYNFIDLNNNNSVIGGGVSNRIANGQSVSSVIVGGNYNNIFAPGAPQANYSVILGGQSNAVYATYGIAAGHNAIATNDNTFIWSDGISSQTKTNSQYVVIATNGMALNGPLWISAANTNSGIYIRSNQFSLWAVTNSWGSGDYWKGNSNGVPVILWNSNGTPVMKNLFP